MTYNWHDGDTSFLEAVLARGDRRLGKVLELAFRKGAHLDAWSEYFDLSRWEEAFAECGLDPAFYANRERSRDEILPWSVISCYVSDQYLWRQRELAYQSVPTPDCRTQCSGCGPTWWKEGSAAVAKLRLMFRKEGRAVYISHLDLLRTFQRVFLREGLVLRHSQGFHPHPLLAFALPLSVGQSSDCELLDFEVDGQVDCAALPENLNRFMNTRSSVWR